MKRIDELRPDPLNANRHTQKGQRVVTDSIQQNKFGRPGLATKTGTVIAGNLSVLEVAAGDLGAEEVVLIHTDGSRPVVHIRDDIEDDSPEAIALALADNRASELSLDWNPEVVEAIRNELPEVVESLWGEAELLDLRTKDTELPVADMQVDSEMSFGRLIPNQTKIVGGFGRFSALVESKLVDGIVKKIIELYGDDPDVAIPEFCADLFRDYFEGEWPPVEEDQDQDQDQDEEQEES